MAFESKSILDLLFLLFNFVIVTYAQAIIYWHIFWYFFSKTFFFPLFQNLPSIYFSPAKFESNFYDRSCKYWKIIWALRCDNSGENRRSISRLASVRCPGGLAFDIERQTCDWKTNVKNCKEVESKLSSSETRLMHSNDSIDFYQFDLFIKCLTALTISTFVFFFFYFLACLSIKQNIKSDLPFIFFPSKRCFPIST